ncbi:hypothetical protein B0H11DRAFT_2294311 [Mycena galericulata]|nr:hypothetical protein B0H11DRAFT_2294311 [Mycena galericulata]
MSLPLSQPELISSRLIHLLESNDVPVDGEIPVIRAIISHNQARVTALNAQLEALGTRMEQIEKERDEIEDTVRKQTTVISPVRRVPPELISEIFSLMPCTRRRADRTVNCPPWRLGHICRSWRHTALSNPFLWRSIEISWAEDWNLLELEAQLLRSGNVPLQVSFSWWIDDNNLPFLDLLLPHCERWGTLRFLIGGPQLSLLSRLRAVQGRLPQLKKLDFIRIIDKENGYGNEEKIEYFSVAPNLHEILLADPEFHFVSPPLILPWNQITRYRGRFHPAQQIKILLASPALVECGLGFIDIYRTNSVRDGRVALLPHLRRLYVEDSDFLDHVTAPLLQHLYVDSQRGGHSESDPVLRFIQRSSCRLTRLVMNRFPYGGRLLVPLLEALPTLEYLIIDLGESSASELTYLWRAMTLDLCPNLTFLAWRGRDGDESSFDAFFTMVRFRAQPILHRRCRLSSLRLIGVLGSVLRNRLEAGLKRWEDELRGLDVALLGKDETLTLMKKDRP